MSNPEGQSELRRNFSRRGVVKTGLLAGAGLAAAAVIGCGGDDDEDAPPSQGTQAAPSSTQTATTAVHAEGDYAELAKADGAPYPYDYPEPEGQPKAGGTMRLAVAWDAANFDTN